MKNILTRLIVGVLLLATAYGWYLNTCHDEVWNESYTFVKDQRQAEIKEKVLKFALHDFLLYCEFKSDTNPSAVDSIPENVRAEALMRRFKAGERDTLLEPTVQGIRMIKTWFSDPEQNPDQAEALLRQRYDNAAKFIPSLDDVRHEFDRRWAQR